MMLFPEGPKRTYLNDCILARTVVPGTYFPEKKAEHEWCTLSKSLYTRYLSGPVPTGTEYLHTRYL